MVALLSFITALMFAKAILEPGFIMAFSVVLDTLRHGIQDKMSDMNQDRARRILRSLKITSAVAFIMYKSGASKKFKNPYMLAAVITLFSIVIFSLSYVKDRKLKEFLTSAMKAVFGFEGFNVFNILSETKTTKMINSDPYFNKGDLSFKKQKLLKRANELKSRLALRSNQKQLNTNNVTNN